MHDDSTIRERFVQRQRDERIQRGLTPYIGDQTALRLVAAIATAARSRKVDTS